MVSLIFQAVLLEWETPAMPNRIELVMSTNFLNIHYIIMTPFQSHD